MTLTPKTRQTLKAKAHKLKPIVMIGSNGFSDAVKNEVDRALTDHELIKIRISTQDREAKNAIYHAVCEACNAQPVQLIGNIAVIYRPRPD